MKVLIVDDEALVRVGIKSIINWEENGCEIIGEANEGKKALEIIHEKKPDIVITDIKMPVMDGITLIRELKTLLPHTRVIVLSSYDDFHLVREALKLGADEYLLKLELNAENLTQIIGSTRLRIEEERHLEDTRLKLQNKMKENLPVLRKKFLMDIVSGKIESDSTLAESSGLLSMKLELSELYCLNLMVSEAYRFDAITDMDLDLMDFSIINISEEIINDYFTGYCFELRTGNYCIIVTPRDKGRQDFSESVLSTSVLRLIEMLRQYINITVTVGISKKHSGAAGVQKAFAEAKKALDWRFFKNNSGVLFWSEVEALASYPEQHYSVMIYRDEIHKALEFFREEEIIRVFQSLLRYLAKGCLTCESACNFALELYYIISEHFECNQYPVKEILKSSQKTYKQLVHIGNFQQLQEWVGQVEADLLSFIGAEKQKDYPKMISKAKKYIEENYSREISLKEVSACVNLHPSYFSTLFQQHTGKSYTEYLMHVRIEKGKALLKQTDYRVYEVAERVGYQNFYYFNKVFKKITGLTPIEYKNIG